MGYYFIYEWYLHRASNLVLWAQQLDEERLLCEPAVLGSMPAANFCGLSSPTKSLFMLAIKTYTRRMRQIHRQ